MYLLDQLLESVWLLNGEFGEYFAVKCDILRFLRRDESAVGKSEETERVPEADDPETSEGALLVVAIPAGVLPRFDESLFCGDEIRLPSPAETDGLFQYILPALVGGDAAFHPGHTYSN